MVAYSGVGSLESIDPVDKLCVVSSDGQSQGGGNFVSGAEGRHLWSRKGGISTTVASSMQMGHIRKESAQRRER